MSLLTILNNAGVEVTTETTVKVTGQITVFDGRDLRQRGQSVSSTSVDLKIQAGISPIVYLGSIGTVSDNTSSAGLTLSTPFINAGTHVILLITHSSGGFVTQVNDSKSNVWTIDKPSEFNSTLGIAIASARISTSLAAGDNIVVTWNAAVTQKAIVGELFRGILATNYVDRTASNADMGYQVNTGVTSFTSNTRELVIGNLATLGAYDITFVPDAAVNLQEKHSQPGNSNNRVVTGAFQVTTSQGTYSITGTLT